MGVGVSVGSSVVEVGVSVVEVGGSVVEIDVVEADEVTDVESVDETVAEEEEAGASCH